MSDLAAEAIDFSVETAISMIEHQAFNDLHAINSGAGLEAFRVKFLGVRGQLRYLIPKLKTPAHRERFLDLREGMMQAFDNKRLAVHWPHERPVPNEPIQFQRCRSRPGPLRARDAMQRVLDFLDGGGLSLDGQGQESVLTLLVAAFTTSPGSVRDQMRDALELKQKLEDES